MPDARSATDDIRPWGATRGVPITPSTDPAVPYVGIVLDERTQVAQYIDGAGAKVEATGHKHEGTTQTMQQTTPTGGGDGQNPQPPDDPKVTTYIPD